ncbi:hypothetical protein GCM10023083_24760 [Streptomyces phyllanthi]
MPGIPGSLLASVFSGAHVMTTTGSSPEPPAVPGTTPHPATSDAHAASAPADSARDLARGRVLLAVSRPGRVLTGREGRVRRVPVMDMHDCATAPTAGFRRANAR